MTRFERQLVPSNFLDRLQVLTSKTAAVARQAVMQNRLVPYGIYGSVVRADPQYSIKFMFSTDSGDSFSESPEITSGINYHVRLEISQLHEDLLAGFNIQWWLPTGWKFVDGLPASTWEEAISNPLIVTRVARSPANAVAAPFRAVILEEFL